MKAPAQQMVVPLETNAGRSSQIFYNATKRALDLTLAAVGLVAVAPLLLLLGVLIKATSRGPVFYTQERVGQSGTVFTMYKLRSMRTDAEADGPQWCRKADNRVTPFGRFLRRAHLDELPQLINIVRGEMSLIGPRPERPHFVKKLKRQIPLYTARLSAKPGLTGLAQVKHGYDQTLEDVQRKLAYDLEYIRHAGLWLDAQILAQTALKIISGRAGQT